MVIKEEVMNKRMMEVVFNDQKEEINSRQYEKLCSRHEQQLVDLESPQAQVVIGVRRSGKSTLCLQALRTANVNFAYANFDDERLAGLSAMHLNDVLEVMYKIYGDFTHIFLDEIQKESRETHLLFFRNSQRLLRENFILLLNEPDLSYMSEDEADFASKFSKFIHERNVVEMMEAFELAEAQVQQNVNVRIILFHLFFLFYKLLHKSRIVQ